ncbi:Cellulose synthase [Rhodovastum atsumiense]|uniref:Cellulose synthase n=1 Tax=Rhodovastum atsumiense TaxID=504468 RepID=A0A5M6IN67_9PROT|nr:cellulose biosynthesis protein BcsD [Rhodovastum atsumiense]KAA5609319.1 cellulose synthase [Rhodovastum atsumiense]CAH2602384.1 Cellulose synthase [Rhodovastum atsumiense]
MSDLTPAPQWRVFLHALAEEIDSQGGVAARDELLRGIGRRMAKLRPILAVSGIDLLTAEINEQLGLMGWGQASLHVADEYPALQIVHTGLPRVGAGGDPPGSWMSALLEGLYQGWLAQQPGSEPGMTVRRESVSARAVTLRYGRRNDITTAGEVSGAITGPIRAPS